MYPLETLSASDFPACGSDFASTHIAHGPISPVYERLGAFFTECERFHLAFVDAVVAQFPNKSTLLLHLKLETVGVNSSLSLSVGLSIQNEAMDVARSAPQGAHYHTDVIYSFP